MWYRIATQGRIIKRIKDLEEKLFDLVKDLIINKEKLLEKKSKLKELTKTNVNEIFEKEINNLL